MSLFNAMYVLCRGRAVTNVGKTCGPTPCLMLAINTFKLILLVRRHVLETSQLSCWFRGRVVCALDYEAGDPGSIPGSGGTTDWLFRTGR